MNPLTDIALELARLIVAGGNLSENIQRWAEDATSDERSAPASKKGAK